VFGFGHKNSVVGLDIGSSSVKAVELKGAGKRSRVSALGSEPIPHDAIVDGAIADRGAVVAAIRRLLDSHRFKSRNIAASLSGSSVIVKRVAVPAMSDAELAESIYWEAEEHIPFGIQDVNLDYQILNPKPSGAPPPTPGETMDVLLVAAKKDRIADCTGVIAQAGRVPVVVDVDAFALQNAYERNYDGDSQGVVVLLNAGASATNINVLAGTQSVFRRDLAIGGNAYTEALQKELNLPFDSAELLKKGQAVEGAAYADALPVLQAMTENVVRDVAKTLDFFRATAASDRIDRVLLSGGSSRVEGFAQAIEARVDAPVEVFDPFRKIAFDPGKLGVPGFENIVPAVAVAVGLALRRAGDR
jgi:type IV pilus assembly protein PilM